MSISIHTKYIPAGNVRGSRVKASCHRGIEGGKNVIWSVTAPFDYSGEEHERAAKALRDKYWPGQEMHWAGSTIDGRGYVFCINPEKVID